MSRTVTYDIARLPELKKRLDATSEKFKKLGYGSRANAARWLIEKGYQSGDISQVAKKVANLLSGYVRGIHPKLRSGGVWRPEEAERVIELLIIWLKTEALKPTPPAPKDDEF